MANEQGLQSRADCGWAGVQVGPMTTPFADSLGFAESYGAIVDQPKPGGPAANAGIEAGDVLTTINGVPLEKSRNFIGIIATQAPGSTIYLNTWRNGQLMRRTVVLGSSACPDQPLGDPSPISRLATRPTATPKAATAFNTSQLGQRGPLLLRGILQLIAQSTKLQSEVNSVLTALAKTVDEVTCTGD
jgi:serine protease Do